MDQSDSRGTIVKEEQHIFESQKLLPADLIFELADNLEGVSKGDKLNAQLASRMAARVADIQLPRNSMSGAEKNSVAFGFYVDKHIDDERKLNFRAMIDKASKDPERLKDIRGLLAPTLRDTIVGYNYIFYAPPGAQILLTNPLFVRGHDFIGMQGANHSWRTTEPYGTGWPSNAGGRLVGSLAGLPYALAESEQNFLVPTQTQALIWGDPGAADDAGRQYSALLGREPGADALGGAEYALRRNGSSRSRGESSGARCGRQCHQRRSQSLAGFAGTQRHCTG